MQVSINFELEPATIDVDKEDGDDDGAQSS